MRRQFLLTGSSFETEVLLMFERWNIIILYMFHLLRLSWLGNNHTIFSRPFFIYWVEIIWHFLNIPAESSMQTTVYTENLLIHDPCQVLAWSVNWLHSRPFQETKKRHRYLFGTTLLLKKVFHLVLIRCYIKIYKGYRSQLSGTGHPDDILGTDITSRQSNSFSHFSTWSPILYLMDSLRDTSWSVLPVSQKK